MLKIDEFKKDFIEKCREELDKAGYEDLLIEERSVVKPQIGELTGICFRAPDSSCAPTIYVEDFFQMYEMERSVEELAEDAVSTVAEALEQSNSLVDPVDYELCNNLDRLRTRLIGSNHNRALLEKAPHKRICDGLVLVAYIEVGDFRALVTNELLAESGMTADELFDAATASTCEHEEPVLFHMSDMLAPVPDKRNNLLAKGSIDPDSDGLYVLSNTEMFWGADAITYPKVIPHIHEILGGDFYAIPSSVHEMILVPTDSEGADPVRLSEMIFSANRNVVDECDLLSYNLYECRSGELRKCEITAA